MVDLAAFIYAAGQVFTALVFVFFVGSAVLLFIDSGRD